MIAVYHSGFNICNKVAKYVAIGISNLFVKLLTNCNVKSNNLFSYFKKPLTSDLASVRQLHISGDIAYHIARAEKGKETVKLRLDMFVLTFGIYGSMIAVAIMVFGVELIVGRKNLEKKMNEEKEAPLNVDGSSGDEVNPETSPAVPTQNAADEIETIAIF